MQMPPPNRLPPAMPVNAYKTYNIATPLATHWTKATCEQVDCPQWSEGWAVQIQGLDEKDLHAMRTSGRRYRAFEVSAAETWWVFEPGQPCFAAATHMRRLERPELFSTRRGDFRGDPTGRGAQPLSMESWVDDCGENQQNLAEWIEKYG